MAEKYLQVWEFVSQGLNIGKWSTGKHGDGVAVVKKTWKPLCVKQTCTKVPKDPRSWVRWVQGLGPWWTLDLAHSFCRGTLETQDLKIVICRKTLETQNVKNSICSETLETQDLKILIVARPWKPRTLKFGYVAKPWKPRTSKFWCLETLKSLDPTPFNTELHAEHCPREFNRWWTRTIAVQKLKL